MTATQGGMVHTLEDAYTILESLLPEKPAVVQVINPFSGIFDGLAQQFVEAIDGPDDEDEEVYGVPA
jgi:hypothetical protein